MTSEQTLEELSPEQLSPAQILRLLRTKLTVDAVVARQALGIGVYAFDNAVERGIIPVVDLGEGAKKRPVPCWWLLDRLGLSERNEEKAAPEGGFCVEGGPR